MAKEPLPGLEPIAVAGLDAALDADYACASLRYHTSSGAAARSVETLLHHPLPATLAGTRSVSAVSHGQAVEVTLVWRSPTETLVLSRDRSIFAQIQSSVAGLPDGCLIDQSGGIRTIRLEGCRVPALFARLGNPDAIPATGQARRTRLADVPVMGVNVGSDEYLLLVERVYAPHLMDWLRETAADLRGIDESE